jgi:aerobic-type carbon monoxide dehydrogenase small subunit (CoxS/CutS family)
MAGNLCRCGTYPKIVRAIQDVAAQAQPKRAHG